MLSELDSVKSQLPGLNASLLHSVTNTVPHISKMDHSIGSPSCPNGQEECPKGTSRSAWL